ncbi:Protein of unknown function [Gryllus bimaculatus]|nr:Protein of unknown function [Gryllus bimaculatus]
MNIKIPDFENVEETEVSWQSCASCCPHRSSNFDPWNLEEHQVRNRSNHCGSPPSVVAHTAHGLGFCVAQGHQQGDFLMMI